MVQLVALTPYSAALVGPGRVLPVGTATRLLALDALRADAEQQVAALVEAARAEADVIREAARKEGHATAAAEIQDRLFEIAEASVSVMARSEERILDLALQIAARIIGTRPRDDVARQIAARSLQLASHSRFIRLRVSPMSVEAVRAQLNEMLPPSLSPSSIEVVGDDRVRDPGCVLETDAGLIDATIESQLAAIRRGLERTLVQRDEAAQP